MTFILLGAALISVVLAIASILQGQVENGEEWLEFMDVIIIFAVVITNAAIGTVQEKKAEKALDALKEMPSPTATVRREGEMHCVKAEDVVAGDIVILEEGRIVPADIRLLESFSLKTNESSLTVRFFLAEKFGNVYINRRADMAQLVEQFTRNE